MIAYSTVIKYNSFNNDYNYTCHKNATFYELLL